MTFASAVAPAVCACVVALVAEPGAVPFLKLDPAFDAKWDRCEALARQRGTPPGKAGYGDFMDACMGKTPARPGAGDGAGGARKT